MSTADEAFDVAVVGAGIVGAVTALLLARAGWRVVMVERRAPAIVTGRLGVDPRTLAISPGSQRLIESVDAWPAVARASAAGPCPAGAGLAQPYLHMCVWDGDGGGELRFTVDDLTPLPPVLGHIVEQSTLTSGLWRALGARPGVTVREGTEVTALRAHGAPACAADADGLPAHRLQLAGGLGDGTQIDARLVIAADGAASPLRGMAGGRVDRKDTGQVAIATIVTHALPHEDTAWQVFRATGPLAFLPLADAERAQPAGEMKTPHVDAGEPLHRSSIVWSCDAAYGDELLQLDDAAFRDALASAFGGRLGVIGAIDARTRIPLVQQQATRYQPRPGVLLVGDAAHVIHPLAGQGVNLGLRDVRLLTEVLGRAPATAAERSALLGNARLIAQYELRARTVNGLALGFMAGIQRLFASDHPLLRMLRSGGMRAVGELAPLRRQLAREAMGQGLLAEV